MRVTIDLERDLIIIPDNFFVKIKQGVPQEEAKKITKAIKDSKMKVQASIQGDEVRVTGKKRDDLQEAIALIKTLGCDRPLQFTNFRD